MFSNFANGRFTKLWVERDRDLARDAVVHTYQARFICCYLKRRAALLIYIYVSETPAERDDTICRERGRVSRRGSRTTQVISLSSFNPVVYSLDTVDALGVFVDVNFRERFRSAVSDSI